MKKTMIILAIILALILQPITFGSELVGGVDADSDSDSDATSRGSRTIQGYHNFTEVVNIITDLANGYPNIVRMYDLGVLYPHANNTPKRTLNNNTLWALKITDNPDQIENDEPKVFYVGVHHAREWISLEVCLYMANQLVKQYATNATVKNMVDSNEIWILPVTNPDGFIYSHEKDDINRSSGSGGWRKNIKETNGIPGFQDNGGGNGDGVDLNRNYGYQWGYDNIGSDPSGGGTTYRGPSAFSEVETQIVRDFTIDKQFATAIAFHSYSEIIIFPWAYKDADTPHHSVFMEMGKEMQKHNGYPPGNPKSGLIYNVNGDFTDYMYATFETLAFTFEISTVFIPPPAQVPALCRENAEAAYIIAKYAKNPIDLFESGIKGTVKDTKGNPLEDVLVATNFLNYIMTVTTDSDGKYSIKAPDGQYSVNFSKIGYGNYEASPVNVPTGSMRDLNIVLKDIVPPSIMEVRASTVLGGNEDSSVFNAGNEVVIVVRDIANETDLTGYAVVNSSSSNYLSPQLDLSYSAILKGYYAYWDTDELGQSSDYRVDARLTDYDGNTDPDGSNDSGPDLVITLLDVTPPVISAVRSSVGSDIGGVYEIGSTVRIQVFEEFHETGLSGTVHIFEENLGYSTGVNELTYKPSNNYYYWDWDTTDIIASANYYVETTLTDQWSNSDLDGLSGYPDITLSLDDTNAPMISGMDSFVGGDFDEVYEQGANITFIVHEAKNEIGLNGHIKIHSPDVPSVPPEFFPLSFDLKKNYYYAFWESGLAVPYADYYVDSALWDPYNNSDLDGADNFGPDLRLTITDTKPPEIETVIAVNNDEFTNSGTTSVTPGSIFEIGETVRVIIELKQFEDGMAGEINISSSELPAGYLLIPVKADLVREHYYALWETHGLNPSNDYWIESVINDLYNNLDNDGSNPAGPDLVLKLVDTTPPEVFRITLEIPGGPNIPIEIIELGYDVRIDVFVEQLEVDLTGKIRISSTDLDYDSGELKTDYNASSGSYSYTWATSGLKPGDDYELEAIFSDRHGNLDPDGLKLGPDAGLVLADTTPPVSITGLAAVEDETSPGTIRLAWSEAEPNATVRVYKSIVPMSSEDDGLLITSIGSGVTTFVDVVEPDGKTYYYLVIITDENGVKNTTISSGNSADVTVTEVESDDETGWYLITLSAILIIIIIIVITLFVLFKKKILWKVKGEGQGFIPEENVVEGEVPADVDNINDGSAGKPPSYENLYKDDI